VNEPAPVLTVAPALGRGAAAIAIHGLTVRFADLLAVDDVSLSIAESAFLSIVGPSGCGKTTILNVLAGLINGHQGRVTVAGRKPAVGNPATAYMLARDSLLPWRTTLANVCYGMEVRGVSKEEREAKARKLIERVGLKGFEKAYPKALSQGMRQRAALARTFCLSAPILLMDEPFGSLDAQTKLQLEDLLLELWSAERRTVVFVTHDLAEAVALSDRIIVMSSRPGRIIADVPVTLSRPRSVRALQKDAAFHELYARVWSKLEEGLAGNEH
jgi:NitT/TauT family transport system ATP-binding protein